METQDELKDFPQLPPETIIWKYFKLEHFKDLIQSSELFFCQVSEFPDAAEGRMNKHQLESLEKEFANDPDRIASMKDLHEYLRQRCWVSCFSRGDFESKEMWQRFPSGVAIRTTYGRLELLRAEMGRTEATYLAAVRYQDSAYLPWKIGYLLYQKLPEPKFMVEKEVRFSICLIKEQSRTEKCSLTNIRERVNLNTLIQKIVVHTKATTDEFRNIQSLVKEKLGRKVHRVVWSRWT